MSAILSDIQGRLKSRNIDVHLIVLLMTIFGWEWLALVISKNGKCVKPFSHSATILNGIDEVWDLELQE